jgi:hypothetical protein
LDKIKLLKVTGPGKYDESSNSFLKSILLFSNSTTTVAARFVVGYGCGSKLPAKKRIELPPPFGPRSVIEAIASYPLLFTSILP